MPTRLPWSGSTQEIRERLCRPSIRLSKSFLSILTLLENRVEAKLAQGKTLEAISILRQLPQTPNILYKLARAEAIAGQAKESELAYERFENAARPLIGAPANADRQLILYYADQGATSPKFARRLWTWGDEKSVCGKMSGRLTRTPGLSM